MPNPIDEAFAQRMAALQAEWQGRLYRPGDDKVILHSVMQIIADTGARIPAGHEIEVAQIAPDALEVRLVPKR